MQASLTGPGGQQTDLPSDILTIGRAPDNRLVLQDAQASSHHAQIQPDAQGYLLVDLNSRNGTFVNEQRLMPQTPRLLISGDIVRIGETRLTYATAGDDEATVRARGTEYVSPNYSPTVAVPPPQSDFMSYQQPDVASFQQPAPSAYPNYQQPTPSAPNYPQADQPGYAQQQQAYPTPSYSQYQQQSYPQQAPWPAAPGQFAPPAAPPVAQRPRQRRTGLTIGVIVLVLLVVGGALLYFLVLRSTPEKTLGAVCSAYTSSDAQGLFNQLSSSAQSQTSVAQLTQQFRVVDAAPINGIKTCNYSNVQESSSTATATMSFTFGNSALNSLVKPVNVGLVDENGTWKLGSATQPTPTQ